jgi:predicted AAA+ superfamily ATPase
VGLLVGLEEGFRACLSHSQWINGVKSVKKILGKQLKDFSAGVLGNMALGGSGGNSLAKALLAEVKAQWYKFVSWIDEFYKQLTE